MGERTKFNGERTTYAEWRLEAQSKLESGGAVIGPEKAQLAYLYMRMEPKAQRAVRAYYEQIMVGNVHDAAGFIRYLDGVYLDPNAPKRALSQLREWRQGDNESFSTFFPKFKGLPAEGMTTAADDTTKLNYLEGALNDTH